MLVNFNAFYVVSHAAYYFQMLMDNPTPVFPGNQLASTREFDMVLTGQAASLFGTALASIGDVDRDGYQGTVKCIQPTPRSVAILNIRIFVHFFSSLQIKYFKNNIYGATIHNTLQGEHQCEATFGHLAF